MKNLSVMVLVIAMVCGSVGATFSTYDCSTWKPVLSSPTMRTPPLKNPLSLDFCRGMNECDACKCVTNEVQELLRDPDVVEVLVDLISEPCYMLPDPMDELCRAMVSKYIQGYITEFESYTPEQLCEMMRMCP